MPDRRTELEELLRGFARKREYRLSVMTEAILAVVSPGIDAIPSDLGILLAMAIITGPEASTGTRRALYADEIRGQLALLGFERLTTQRISASLGRMCREEMACVERVATYQPDPLLYRLTRHGRTLLGNRYEHLRAVL